MEIGQTAGQRAEFQKKNEIEKERLKKSYETRIENLEDSAAIREKNLIENNEIRRRHLIDGFQDRINILSDKGREILKANKEQYQKDLKENNRKFEGVGSKQASEFSKRLADIQKSYDVSINNNLRENAKHLDNMEKKTEATLAINSENKNNEIKEIQENAEKNILKNRDEMAKEGVRIREEFQQKIQISDKEHIDGKNILKEEHRENTDNIRTEQKEELDRMRESHEDRIKLTNSESKKIDDLEIKKYQRLTKKLQEKSVKDLEQQNLDFQRKKNQQISQHDKEIFNMARNKKTAILSNVNADGGEFQKQEMRDIFNHKIDAKEGLLFDEREKYERNIQNLRLKQDEALDIKSKELREQQNKVEAQFENSLKDKTKEIRDNQTKIENFHNRELRNLAQKNEEQLVMQQGFYKKVLENQRRNYSDNVKGLENANIENVKKMQSEHIYEKDSISQKHRKEIIDTLIEQRDGHSKKLEKVVQSYEKKLSNKNVESDRYREKLDGKLQTIERSGKIQLEGESKYYKEMTKFQREEMNRKLDDERKDHQRELLSVRGQFEKELGDVKRENDVITTKLIQRHNENKARMILEHQTELRQKLNAAQDKLARVIKDEGYQKDILVQTYEKRLEDLRKNYELEKISLYQNQKAQANVVG